MGSSPSFSAIRMDEKEIAINDRPFVEASDTAPVAEPEPTDVESEQEPEPLEE